MVKRKKCISCFEINRKTSIILGANKKEAAEVVLEEQKETVEKLNDAHLQAVLMEDQVLSGKDLEKEGDRPEWKKLTLEMALAHAQEVYW